MTRAQRLHASECDEAALARQMQTARVQRNQLQDEIRRLRMSLTQADADEYEALKSAPLADHNGQGATSYGGGQPPTSRAAGRPSGALGPGPYDGGAAPAHLEDA